MVTVRVTTHALAGVPHRFPAVEERRLRDRSGQSVDQYAAEHLRQQTTFGSLEIGTETGRPLGKWDSGLQLRIL